MNDPETRARWQEWVNRTCAELGLDPAEVDVAQILGLTKQVAHRFERPMAPVSAYLVGLAVGHGLGTADEISARIVADLPPAQ